MAIKLTQPDFFILDIPPFQRLRGVLQLSFVDRIYPGANSISGLDLLAMARRCLQIVGICLRGRDVFASDLVDYVPWQLQEEVVREKAEDYGYQK